MRALLFALALSAAVSVRAELAPDDAAGGFVIGLRAYEAGDYSRAVDVLEEVLAVTPACARCAHVLGKSYGRLAEQAVGFAALGFARKTRDALELAVELDPDDPQALSDLIRYYRAAPGFLGGNAEKARLLEERLLQSAEDHSS
jgi:tetratricopeptide (TPR) repeat protein